MLADKMGAPRVTIGPVQNDMMVILVRLMMTMMKLSKLVIEMMLVMMVMMMLMVTITEGRHVATAGPSLR